MQDVRGAGYRRSMSRNSLARAVLVAVGGLGLVVAGPVGQAAADPPRDDWVRLRTCESSGRYDTDTGNGYYGAYQFAATTWWSLGYSGYPHHAPPWVQDEAALALYNLYGWSPWPGCSWSLGLR